MSEEQKGGGSVGGGEHQRGRAAMDDLKGRLVREGISPERAEQIARETALREDRRRNNK